MKGPLLSALAIFFAFPVVMIAFVYWVELVGRAFETFLGAFPL